MDVSLLEHRAYTEIEQNYVSSVLHVGVPLLKNTE